MSSILDWTLNPDDNDRSDKAINWREGQAPSSINNSARGMMARTAEFIQDSFGLVKAEGGPVTYRARILMDIKKLDPRISFECIFNQRPAKHATLNINGLGSLPLLRRAELSSNQPGFKQFIGDDVLVGVPYRVRFISPEYLKDYPQGAFFIADVETETIFLKKEGFQENLPYQQFYYKRDGLVRQWGYKKFRGHNGNIGWNGWGNYVFVTYIQPFKTIVYPTIATVSNAFPHYVPYINAGNIYKNGFGVYYENPKTSSNSVSWYAIAYEPD